MAHHMVAAAIEDIGIVILPLAGRAALQGPVI
jgi:hypothetical protein